VGSSFSLPHVDIQFSQHHLLKRLSLLQHAENQMAVTVFRIRWLQLCGLISGSSILFHLATGLHVFVSVPCFYYFFLLFFIGRKGCAGDGTHSLLPHTSQALHYILPTISSCLVLSTCTRSHYRPGL
jgi:hypothetical protein